MTKDFPIEFYPKEIQHIILETVGVLRFSQEYLSACILSAAAASIGNTYAIRVKNSWIERPTLFLAILGSRGVNKSAPLSFAMSPITDYERVSYKEYKDYIKEFESNPDNANKHPEPLTKMIMGDATQEAVVQQLHKNERGIAVVADELKGFFNSMDRYQSKSEEFYLSVWSGKQIVVDRKTSASILVSEPVVNIIGTIQPSVLEAAFNEKVENGFADRWLLVNPPDVTKPYWSDDDIRVEVLTEYSRIITRMISLKCLITDYGQTSRELSYDPEAWKLLCRWQKRNTDKINETQSETIKGIRAKMETYVHRFALLGHLLAWAAGQDMSVSMSNKVSIDTVDKACRLAEYFLHNTLSFRSDEPGDTLTGKFKELYDMMFADDLVMTTAQIVDMGVMCDIPEVTLKRWITKSVGKYITKVSHGKYSKK